MRGVPDHDPAQTQFDIDLAFTPGEIVERDIELDDGRVIQFGVSGSDPIKVVVFSEDLSVEQVLWTGVYIAHEVGIPGDKQQTIRAMSDTAKTDTYRLGGLYLMEGLE